MRLTLDTATVLPGRRHDRRLVGVPRDISDGGTRSSSDGCSRRTKVEGGGVVVLPSDRVDERMGVATVERLHDSAIERPDLQHAVRLHRKEEMEEKDEHGSCHLTIQSRRSAERSSRRD